VNKGRDVLSDGCMASSGAHHTVGVLTEWQDWRLAYKKFSSNTISINVLFWETFEGLGWPEMALEKCVSKYRLL